MNLNQEPSCNADARSAASNSAGSAVSIKSERTPNGSFGKPSSLSQVGILTAMSVALGGTIPRTLPHGPVRDNRFETTFA